MSARSVGFFVEHPADIALYSAPSEVIKHKCRCGKLFTGKPKDVLEAYREHVYNSDHCFELEDCGCCGGQHFPEFDGDCREDFERF